MIRGQRWQTILWREWRDSDDREFASLLFPIVADEPVDWTVTVSRMLLWTVYGSSVGLLIGILAANWHVFNILEKWDLLGSNVQKFLVAGFAAGFGGGCLEWLYTGRGMTWERFVSRHDVSERDILPSLRSSLRRCLLCPLDALISLFTDEDSPLKTDDAWIPLLIIGVGVLVGALLTGGLSPLLCLSINMGIASALLGGGFDALLEALIGPRLIEIEEYRSEDFNDTKYFDLVSGFFGAPVGVILGLLGWLSWGIGLVFVGGLSGLISWLINGLDNGFMGGFGSVYRNVIGWLSGGPSMWLWVWLLLGLLAGLLSSSQHRRPIIGLVSGLASGLSIGLLFHSPLGLLTGLAFGLGSGFASLFPFLGLMRESDQYQLCLWWWRRPYAGTVEAALREACLVKPHATTILAEPLRLLEKGKTLPNPREIAVTEPGDPTRRFLARHMLFELGGEVVEDLRKIVGERPQSAKTAAWLIRSIAYDTKVHLRGKASRLLCPHHLLQCSSHKVSISYFALTYYGCRLCGQSRHLLGPVHDVIAVLDISMQRNWEIFHGTVQVNCLKRESLFDFNKVEIIYAPEYDIERFCVQVGNDTDKVRRPRYRKMRCSVHPQCRLSQSTLNILKHTFGTVIMARPDTYEHSEAEG